MKLIVAVNSELEKIWSNSHLTTMPPKRKADEQLMDRHYKVTKVGPQTYAKKYLTVDILHEDGTVITPPVGGWPKTTTLCPPVNTGIDAALVEADLKPDRHTLWDFCTALVEDAKDAVYANEEEQKTLTLTSLGRIVREEVNTEVEAVRRRVRGEESELEKRWFNKKLKWWSWTALLTLFYCLDKKIINSYALSTDGLKPFLKDYVLAYLTKEGKSPAKFKECVRTIMTHFAILFKVLFPIGVMEQVENVASQWPNQVAVYIKSHPGWTNFDLTEYDYKKLILESSFHAPQFARELAKQSAEKRKTKALVQPQRVSEVDFHAGLRSLLNAVFGSVRNVTAPVAIRDDTHCAQALCLIQLLCGSRSRGVIGTNWYNKLSEVPDEEIKRKMDSSSVTLQQEFKGLDYLLYVLRLSKVRDEEVLLFKAKSHIAKTLDQDITEIGDDQVDVDAQPAIAKPILYMYLDAAFLDAHLEEKRGELGAQKAIDIFLSLAATVRKYVGRKANIEYGKLIYTEAPMGMHKMLGFSEEFKHSQEAKEISNSWNIKMTAVVKKFFGPLLRKSQGSHMLRKLYVNRAYYFFGSDKFKETGFAARVLGHSSFGVTLFYTSLIFDAVIAPPPPGDLSLLINEISMLRARVDALEDPDPQDDEKFVFFKTIDKGSVTLPVFKKQLPGASPEERVARGYRIAQFLRDNNVHPTFNKMHSLGFPKVKAIVEMYKDIHGDPKTIARSEPIGEEDLGQTI